MTRDEMATELLRGCPDESSNDHETCAVQIRQGCTLTQAQATVDNWPMTYSWLADHWADLTD
jgi:hypothetical protein